MKFFSKTVFFIGGRSFQIFDTLQGKGGYDMSKDGQSLNSQKKLLSLLIALVALLLVGVGVIIFLLSKNDSSDSKKPSLDDAGTRGTVITEENAEEVLQQMATENENIEDAYYTASMSLDWHFDGKESKDAYVLNDVENTRTVYFDMFLADSGEMIYSSPYIPVGAELKGVTLDTELESGTYETILVYHLVDDDNNELTTVSVALTIHVQ